MTGLLAASIGFQEKPAMLAIFGLTYLGIAMGRVPGLKLNRTGIALLGAIAIMIFGGIGTTTLSPSSTGRRSCCCSVFLSFRRNCGCPDFLTRSPAAFLRGSAIPRGFC